MQVMLAGTLPFEFQSSHRSLNHLQAQHAVATAASVEGRGTGRMGNQLTTEMKGVSERMEPKWTSTSIKEI